MSLFSKIKSGLKKVGNAIRGGLTQLVNVVKEVANRVFGVVDFIGTLIGIVLPKKLRLRVVILRDEGGSFLATPSQVQPAIDRAITIFKQQLNTTVMPAGDPLTQQYDPIPPTAALEPKCDGGAWTADFGEAGAFYSLVTATSLFAAPTGYATPVTVIIVRDVQGKKGCSLGPLTDYVTLDLDGIATIAADTNDDVRPQIGRLWLAHEVGHSCGLWHVGSESNLMHKTAEHGVSLNRVQKAVARNSRHITFL